MKMSASTALSTACERVPTGAGPVLVGVSGGCDSMTLLHMLHGMGMELVACHVNVGLRGAESDADEAFVEAAAKALGIPFRSERVSLPPGNTQDAARRARRSLFERCMRETGAACVALAHHQDDQVETILLQWLRGGRADALTGMATRNGPYVRPWLDIPAADIRAFAREAGLTWREDRSNADRRYLRNRLRLDVVPGLDRRRVLAIAEASWDLGRQLDRLLAGCSEGPTLLDRLFETADADIAALAVHRFARKANLRVSDAECAALMPGGLTPGKRVGPFVREADGWSLVVPEPPPPAPPGMEVRRWRPGDRLEGRKVSDRMSDGKWPHWMRAGAWVVVDGSGHVVGLRKPVSSDA